MAAPMSRHRFLLDGEERTASRSGISPYIAPALPLLGDQRKKVPATPLPTVRAYEIVASDSICVDRLAAQPTGDDVGKGLAELKIEEGTSVKLSGEGLPAPVDWFEKVGLAESVLQNLSMFRFETPTPVQRYSMPMVLAGRDLLVCAQEGSGKVAALLIPVVSGLVSQVRAAAAGGQSYSYCAKPRALLLVPNIMIAAQIAEDATKLVNQTGIRVVYSRKDRHVQICELQSGVDIFISTLGCLVEMLKHNRVTLEAIEYLVICDIDRLLDLGFEGKLREIFHDLHMPGKSARQTLLSSDTFEPEVQKFAMDFLSDYLLITDGRLEFSIGLTSQNIELVSEGDKRGILLNVLQKQSYHFACLSADRFKIKDVVVYACKEIPKVIELLDDKKALAAKISCSTNYSHLQPREVYRYDPNDKALNARQRQRAHCVMIVGYVESYMEELCDALDRAPDLEEKGKILLDSKLPLAFQNSYGLFWGVYGGFGSIECSSITRYYLPTL